MNRSGHCRHEAVGRARLPPPDACGKGRRGLRDAAWDESSNIRIEILCDAEIADAIARHLQARYYDDYGMVLFVNDVSVLRPEKF
ncbi:MAG: P-II family nitrogen regulator [Gammaproteobacteria bacterium]|jgi:hypothetical protein|nr:MAG: hypothetical protein ABS56_01790 [Lautropia sp. SCN 69-89]